MNTQTLYLPDEYMEKLLELKRQKINLSRIFREAIDKSIVDINRKKETDRNELLANFKNEIYMVYLKYKETDALALTDFIEVYHAIINFLTMVPK